MIIYYCPEPKPYFFLLLVDDFGNSAVYSINSLPCMYGCNTLGMRRPCNGSVHDTTHVEQLMKTHLRCLIVLDNAA